MPGSEVGQAIEDLHLLSGIWKSFLSGGRRVKRAAGTPIAIWLGLASMSGFALAEQPQAIATQTQLSATTQPSMHGTRANFTVHVGPLSGNANASGAVTLVDGGGLQLGSAVLNENGDATIQTSALLPGRHAVHALYGGTGSFAGSLSPEADVTAEASPETSGTPGFTATASPTALNVTQGDTISTTITLTPQNGFSNYVSLSCTGLPADTTCTFLPVNVFVSGTTATTSILSIETYGPTGPNALLRQNRTPIWAFVFPGMVGIAGLGMRRRGWRNAGRMLVAVAGIWFMTGAMSGCSQRYHYLNRPPAASTGTGLGSTDITIEAQAVSGVVVTTDLITNVVLTVNAPASN